MKREKLRELLEAGMVMIHLDARREGVWVPGELRGDPHLRLNLSYRFRPCDIEIDEESVSATLTFGGVPWPCRIPFSALFGMTLHDSGESLVWLEDVPEEILISLMSNEPTAVAAAATSVDEELSRAVGARGGRRDHLRVVK